MSNDGIPDVFCTIASFLPITNKVLGSTSTLLTKLFEDSREVSAPRRGAQLVSGDQEAGEELQRALETTKQPKVSANST